MKRVLTVGTFDLIHPGHLDLLSRCRGMAGPGGTVTVGVNSDDFVARYKGHEPVMAYEDRTAVLASLRDVDAVLPNWGDEDSKPLVEFADPDILAIGEDWRTRDYHAQMRFTARWLNERQIELVYLPLLEGYSSTGLRQVARTTRPIDKEVAAKGHPPMAEGVVLVDFDNTLYPIGRLFGSPPPKDGAVEAMNRLHDGGFRIGIHTSRLYPEWLPTVMSTEAEQTAYIERLLTRDGIPWDFITGQKAPAVAYIDDKAIRFTGDWEAVVDQVLR